MHLKMNTSFKVCFRCREWGEVTDICAGSWPNRVRRRAANQNLRLEAYVEKQLPISCTHLATPP